MNREAQNLEAIVKARDHHNKGGCPYNGTATEVHMAPFDVERMEWEDGDVIAGLTLVADSKQQTGHFRVYCDVELGGGGLTEEEAVKAVSGTPVHVPEKV